MILKNRVIHFQQGLGDRFEIDESSPEEEGVERYKIYFQIILEKKKVE